MDEIWKFEGIANKKYRSVIPKPNSANGPIETKKPLYKEIPVAGVAAAQSQTAHREDNDFSQAGDLYRLMSTEEKSRLVENIATGLSSVNKTEIIERSLEHFRKADADYGERLAKRVKELRAKNINADVTVQAGKP